MRARPAVERAALAGDFETQVIPWFSAGAASIRPIIGARYPMAAIAEAHAAMEADRVFGKIVMTW